MARYAWGYDAMRRAILLMSIGLCGCGTADDEFRVLSHTPAGIEYSVWTGAHSREVVTDMAQQYCQREGKKFRAISRRLVLDRKKLAAFSAAAGRFLQFPIGDRRCNRTRASVGNAGGNPPPSLTNAALTASRLLHRRSPTAPCSKAALAAHRKKLAAFSALGPPRTGEGRKRAKERGVRFGRPRKMTPHERQEALQRLAEGETQADVARTYAVDAATISRLAAASPF